ncbi:MAG: PLP-dependent aminotransferase family protein [Lachnospiraceae bacterium]|nr:PLP-dependent aminotransferase family protein [Lachnospiraceae bacterium]
MNYIIDTNSHIPAYLQLYRLFIRDITSGVYPYMTKLPSKRTIANDVCISVITAEHALSLLCDEGYIESRERSGYYVIYREDDFLNDSVHSPSVSHNNAYVSNPIDDTHSTQSAQSNRAENFPFSVIARTMRKVLLDKSESILVKSPNRGSEELRSEICHYLARSRGIFVGPEQVVIGAGAEYLYGLIAQLLGRDQIYAIEDPCYNKISHVYNALGIKCDPLLLTPEGISSASLAATKAHVIHVTPFNSFPSGISVGISKKKEYLRWAASRGGVIIEDNYDSELTVSSKAEDTLFSMSNGDHVIYLNTFSKTIAPSLRVGYMLLPTELLNSFTEKLGFYSCTVPLFEQFVLAELLRSGDFERHINRIRRKKRVLLYSRTTDQQSPTSHNPSR